MRAIAGVVLGLSLLASSLWPSLPEAAEIPAAARQYRADLTAAARRVFGIYAPPIATLAAQVHQESGWRADARSYAGARGLTQFMDRTAVDVEERYPDLVGLARYSPRWALRAQALYMRDLVRQVALARDGCERYAFALQAYVGGMRWVRERQARSRTPEVCLYSTCRINPGITAANQRQASGYPERIIDVLEPLYLGWGAGSCH